MICPISYGLFLIFFFTNCYIWNTNFLSLKIPVVLVDIINKLEEKNLFSKLLKGLFFSYHVFIKNTHIWSSPLAFPLLVCQCKFGNYPKALQGEESSHLMPGLLESSIFQEM